MITVAKEKFTATFATLQEAFDSIPPDNQEPVTITVPRGIYREKLYLNRNHVSLIGEDAEDTIICFGDFGYDILADGEKRGTFRTPTFFIDGNDFTAKNITFQNDAGPGKEVGQALALYVDGDRIYFEDCRFIASQDTLFTAPLPPFAYEPNGLRGLKEFTPRLTGRHYYKNCFIQGDIDFIFGGGIAFFEGCEIYSQNINENINGYVTAASTPEGQAYGYVFYQCHFTGNCPPHTVYLGRPWREFAQTVIINCQIEDHIHPAGWHDWNKPTAHTNAYYGEYGNFGAGSDMSQRPAWIRRLTDDDATNYTKTKVLAGTDGWNP